MEDGIPRRLQHRHEMCCEKGGRRERQACMVQKWLHHGDVISGQVDLYMTLMILFAVYTLEGVGARLALFSFKTKWVNLEVCFATPSKMTMMFGFVWTITLDTSRSLKTVHEHCMTLLPTIFTLGSTRVHISTPDSCDKASYIETSINDLFSR